MEEIRTAAKLVEEDALAGALLAVAIRRAELAAAAGADGLVQLWLELEDEEGGEAMRLALDLPAGSVNELLRRAAGEEIALALDGEAVARLLDAEVEAHGWRGALAIAVAAAATAPAALAATPQTASLAAKAQVAKAQVAKAQVAKAQVAKPRLSTSLAVRAGGLRILRGGLAG
jgi:antitoxin (DNA-binding transcriptional repressor) of toxin-antitoxin stability system